MSDSKLIEFKLPSLGADMEQGKLLEWKVKPGDTVERGQIVAVVDTSKAAVDVESWQAGTVYQLLAQPGASIPVGTVMATFLEPGQSAAALTAAPVPETFVPPAKASASPALQLRKPSSPAARRRAHELNIDIDQVTGTGPHGVVTVDDVERHAAVPAVVPAAPAVSAPEAGAARPDRTAEMRRAIAAAMSRSKREIPHYYLAETICMRKASDWLAAFNAGRSVAERILMGALQLKAVALALKRYPELNGYWREAGYQAGSGIHIGVAISLRQGGLIAPAIHDVDSKALPELMRGLSDLVTRARAGSLRSSEMSDATITVTNLGDQGVDAVQGVIYPPQVALVGFGRVALRPWVEDHALSAQPLVVASLAADHRVSDGHRGARFLTALNELLQRPEAL